MYLSKYTSKLISLTALFSLLFLSACNLPDTQKRADGSDSQGSFFADEVSGSFLSESFLEDISLPKERVYAMKVCLRDLKHSKPVLNHPFLIEETKQEVSTDASGCLTWNESIVFEYLTDPVFIKIDRKIKSAGIHSGSYGISFAINPWDTDNYHNAIDLSKNKIQPLVAADDVKNKLSGKSQTQLNDLWVEDGRLFANDEKMGDVKNNKYELKYEFNIAPYIKTKKTSGEATQYNLKSGLFSGRVEIIQRYFMGGASEKNSYEILSSENFKDIKMEKSILSFSRIFTFKGGPPSRGSLFVRLYLQPTKPVTNLKSFVGVFPIGDFRSIRTNQFLKILPSTDFIKELEAQIPLNKDYVSQGTTGQTSSAGLGSNKDNPSTNAKAKTTISESMLEFDSPAIGKLHLNQRKKITFPVHICFNNNLISMPLAFQKFTVKGFSQNEFSPGEDKGPNIVSNKDGCIFWTDTIEYDIYECRHYFRGYVIIESPDFNLKLKKYYYVNPWDEYFGAKDVDKINNPKDLNTSCDTENPKKSEVILQDVSFKTHAMPYTNAINSFLEFNAAKRLGITMHPKVKIPSDLKNDYDHGLIDLIDGAYLLRVLIVKNLKTTEKMDVIAHKDIPVLLRSGTLYGELEFNLKDHRLFHTRNTLFVQLLPIKHDKVTSESDYELKLKDPNEKIEDIINNETSLLYPIYFEDIIMDGENFKTLRSFSGSEYTQHLQIEFKNGNGNINFPQLIADFKAKSQVLENSKKVPKPDVYAISQNLDYTDDTRIGNLPFANALKLSLDTSKLNFDKKANTQLCSYWFQHYWKGKFNLGEALLRRACESAANSNIKAFFDFDHVRFIKSVTESQFVGAGPEKSISIGTSFSVSNTYSETWSNSIGAGAKLGIGKDIGKFASLGAEAYMMLDFNRSTSNSDSNSISLGESTTLSATESTFKINTNSYQYCLSIKPKAQLFKESTKVWYKRWWNGEFDFSSFFKSNLSDQEKVSLTNKGLLVCKSTQTTTPFTLQESYYWITQSMSPNEIQDPNDYRNKRFSIMIRGNSDYNRFKFYLTQKWQRPTNADASEAMSYLTNLIELQSWKTSPTGIHINHE